MELSRIRSLIGSAGGRENLPEIESKQIIEALGIATAMPHLAATASEAANVAGEIGYPVVLKVHSQDLTHKSDVGGVMLNIGSREEVIGAFEQIRRNASEKAPGAYFEGVTVQPMAAPGLELIAGIIRDPSFGPMVVVGLGGIMVEVLKDTTMRLAPITLRESMEMLEELRGVELLRGARGRGPVDRHAIASLLVQISELAAGCPEMAEMDLNPVVAYEQGLKVLDARIRLQATVASEDSTRSAERIENLKRAFTPSTVAVIGDKRMGGYMWLRAEAKYTGKLYSVQIDPNEIPGIEAMGVKNYKSLAEIPEKIDYAITAVPRQVAPRILKDCIDNGVRSVIFFTSGFSETGEEVGAKLENELRKMAETSDIALIGPNCMGLYNPAVGLCNFPDENVGERGDVCFISQSGTHTINFALQAPVRGIKVNKAASIGNAIILKPHDYISLLSSDEGTRALGMYIEGPGDGRRFFEAVREAVARIPVVIWKGGLTEAGARATFSHTASLATHAAVWNAMVRQSGAVQVDGLDSMLDALELLARGRPVRGRGMGLVAMTGGQSVVITDTFARAGLDVPQLSPSSYEELKQFFNIVGGSYRNPLDAGGTIGAGHAPGNLDRILSILDRDPVIDAIVLEIGPGFSAPRWERHEDELTSLLNKLAAFNNKTAKPFAVILHPSHVEAIVARAKHLARERGLVVYDSFERAAAAFQTASDYWMRRAAAG